MEKTAEEKNLNAQLSLYSDILQKERYIKYLVSSRARLAFCLFNENSIRNKDLSMTITNETFDKIYAIFCDIIDSDNLGSFVNDHTKEIKIKEDILNQLK